MKEYRIVKKMKKYKIRYKYVVIYSLKDDIYYIQKIDMSKVSFKDSKCGKNSFLYCGWIFPKNLYLTKLEAKRKFKTYKEILYKK